MINIGIIGAGFVGSACEVGFSSCPDLEVLVHDKYKPTESLLTVVSKCRILFLCLPTPMREDGSCDTTIIRQVVGKINSYARTSKIIVVKSTVPPGTIDSLQEEYGNKHTFFFNPEFLTEANFIDDFLTQKIIFLGKPNVPLKTETQLYLSTAYQMFTASQKQPAKIIWVDAKSAEMFKYTVNTFLATKVSFFNEIYQICAASSISYDSVRDLLERDERIGKTHTKVPGPDGQFGFGGSCFPKDTNALMAFAKENGVDPLVLESIWTKNMVVREKYEWSELPQVTGEYATA